MSLDNLVTLAEVEIRTGESRHLINFLIRDREIPHWRFGMAKVLDQDGLKRLKEAIKEYHGRADSERSSRTRQQRRSKRKSADPDPKNFKLKGHREKLEPVTAS